MSFLQFIGLLLLMDDIRDIGKLDRLHHYHLGLALVVLG